MAGESLGRKGMILDDQGEALAGRSRRLRTPAVENAGATRRKRLPNQFCAAGWDRRFRLSKPAVTPCPWENRVRMTTQTALEIENLLPATFTAPGLSEAEFLELCEKFPDAILEYTADGTVIVMPPTDPESGVQNGEVFRQLADWNKQQGRGMVSGPDAGFFLPDGSRRSPDAAWFDPGYIQ